MIEKVLKVYYETSELKEADKLIPGMYYRSIYGDRLKCVKGNLFKKVSDSPLVKGEFMCDLTPKQYELFIKIEKKANRWITE